MVDTIAHALWSVIIFRNFDFGIGLWLAIFLGIMPDLFSWTIYAIYSLFKGERFGVPNLKKIPKWAFTLYGITHSVFVVLLVFILIYLGFGTIPIFLWAWPLHVLIDIPTHSRKFLPTPFLWPLFDWKFPGISWGTPWIMILNWLLILFFLAKIVFGF